MNYKIYIIAIKNTASAWIYDAQKISKKLKELFLETDLDTTIIDSMDNYENLLNQQEENYVIINCHGEAIPITSEYGDDWISFLKNLGNKIKELGWIYVSITGYPVFYTVKPNQEIIPTTPINRMNGLGALISVINGQIKNVVVAQNQATLEGEIAVSNFSKYSLPEMKNLWVSRCFIWDNPQPIKRFYSSGPIVGAGSIKIGNGWFIYNGMMATDFGSGPSEYSDYLFAHYAFAFVYHTITETSLEDKLSSQYQFLNSIANDLLVNLPSQMSEWNKITEPRVQKEIETVLNLKYRAYDFRKEKVEFPYSITSYKPDFTSEIMKLCIEVKICTQKRKPEKIVREINDDIVAYKTRYSYIVFIVYDSGKYVPNKMLFINDIEKYNSGVKIIII